MSVSPSTEWSLQRLIRKGLIYITAHLELVDAALEGYDDIDPTVITEVKTYLTNHPSIEVVINWPRRDISLPFVSIITRQNSEDESKDSLGDNFEMEDILGDITVDGVLSNEITGHSQSIGYASNAVTDLAITSEDPNMTLYLFDLVRFIIFTHKIELEDKADLKNMKLDSRDFQFDPSYFPDFWYSRALTLSYLTYYHVKGTGIASLPVSKKLDLVSAVVRFAGLTLLIDDPVIDAVGLQNVTGNNP